MLKLPLHFAVFLDSEKYLDSEALLKNEIPWHKINYQTKHIFSLKNEMIVYTHTFKA